MKPKPFRVWAACDLVAFVISVFAGGCAAIAGAPVWACSVIVVAAFLGTASLLIRRFGYEY